MSYPKRATALTIGWCAIKSGFNAGTGNDSSLSLLKGEHPESYSNPALLQNIAREGAPKSI
jgi:hypothetical protein